jgi:tetratricopeptide (TPR) repeat protein
MVGIDRSASFTAIIDGDGASRSYGTGGLRMMKRLAIAVLAIAFGGSVHAADDEHHSHPAPEKLGTVTFPTSCAPALKPAFERALALLHSFAYAASEQAFRDVAARDPSCAIAHWGIAMSLFHQLWEPPSGPDLREGAEQSRRAVEIRAGSHRERQFIEALDTYYRDAQKDAHGVRAERYARAMAEVARSNPSDPEAQIFYALALIATAPPADKAHSNQKQAAKILEPLFRQQPQHPGLAHYLIHAYDSAELAPQGLAAARAYSKIAPSAPHALHMPSHIFTRLGLWDDSIASNQAARAAAHKQGDLGEELHAMDYLTYAYLQRGRYADAEQVVADLRSMNALPAPQFKVGYAATAMPVRLAIERRDWDSAASLEPLPQSAPHVAALVYWARALGQARAGHPRSSDVDIGKLQACLSELKSGGNLYWATQVDVLIKEAQAWRSATDGDAEAAVLSLRTAADEEDAVEKLPVTPGPIVPAREQLGELLLGLQRPDQALREFQTALTFAPDRRGALVGAITAAERLGDTQTATQLRAELAQ